MFENSAPGLPEAAAEEGLSPLAYMRKYGVFEVVDERLEALPSPTTCANGSVS